MEFEKQQAEARAKENRWQQKRSEAEEALRQREEEFAAREREFLRSKEAFAEEKKEYLDGVINVEQREAELQARLEELAAREAALLCQGEENDVRKEEIAHRENDLVNAQAHLEKSQAAAEARQMEFEKQQAEARAEGDRCQHKRIEAEEAHRRREEEFAAREWEFSLSVAAFATEQKEYLANLNNLEEREAELNARLGELAAREASFLHHGEEHDKREAEIAYREAVLINGQDHLEKRLAAAAREAELIIRHDALNRPALEFSDVDSKPLDPSEILVDPMTSFKKQQMVEDAGKSTTLPSIGHSSGRRHVLEELCPFYWRPIYAALKEKFHFPHNDAQDLARSFISWVISGRVLRKDALEKRFRTALLEHLDEFVSTLPANQVVRNGHAANSGVGAGTELQNGGITEFDRTWALATFQEALDRLRAVYVKEGRGAEFDVLHEFLFKRRGGGISGTVTAERLGVSEAELKSLASRFGLDFRRLLVEVVEPMVSEEDLDDELDYLWRAFEN